MATQAQNKTQAPSTVLLSLPYCTSLPLDPGLVLAPAVTKDPPPRHALHTPCSLSPAHLLIRVLQVSTLEKGDVPE